MSKKEKYFTAGAAALLLVIAVILISTVGLFGISYEKVVTVSETIESDAFITYYPDFSEPLHRSFYYFKGEDILISAGRKELKGKFLLDISSGGKAQDGAFVYECRTEKWSRPAVYGDIVSKTLKYGIYDYNRYRWVIAFTKTENVVEGAYIKILESSIKDDLR